MELERVVKMLMTGAFVRIRDGIVEEAEPSLRFDVLVRLGYGVYSTRLFCIKRGLSVEEAVELYRDAQDGRPLRWIPKWVVRKAERWAEEHDPELIEEFESDPEEMLRMVINLRFSPVGAEGAGGVVVVPVKESLGRGVLGVTFYGTADVIAVSMPEHEKVAEERGTDVEGEVRKTVEHELTHAVTPTVWQNRMLDMWRERERRARRMIRVRGVRELLGPVPERAPDP